MRRVRNHFGRKVVAVILAASMTFAQTGGGICCADRFG